MELYSLESTSAVYRRSYEAVMDDCLDFCRRQTPHKCCIDVDSRANQFIMHNGIYASAIEYLYRRTAEILQVLLKAGIDKDSLTNPRLQIDVDPTAISRSKMVTMGINSLSSVRQSLYQFRLYSVCANWRTYTYVRIVTGDNVSCTRVLLYRVQAVLCKY